MQQVIGELLPLALGIAISPIPVIAIILMLITPKARSNGVAFLFGWMTGLLVVGGIALFMVNASDLTSTSDTSTVAQTGVRLALGLLLLVVSVRTWRGRPKPGEQGTLPKWMRSLDSFTPIKAFGLAAALSGLNPKNLALNVAAMSTVVASGLATVEQVTALLVVVLIGSSTIIAPVLVYLMGGDRATGILGDWKLWLSDNNATITSVLLLILGAVLVGQSITGM